MPEIKTKFELGQTLYAITQMYVTRKINCVTCDRTGKVTINKEEFVCPKCKGTSKQDEYAGHRWITGNIGQVGSIRVEFKDNKYSSYLSEKKNKEDEIPVYTLNGTSGLLLKETELFLTKNQAQEACDIRNANTKWEDDK